MDGKERGQLWVEVGEILHEIWTGNRTDNMADLAKKGLTVKEMKAYEQGYLSAAREAKATGELVLLAASANATNEAFMDIFQRTQADIREIDGL